MAKKIVISNPEILGVMPGSTPPELCWHTFVPFDDGVEHWINGVLRATIPAENFADYLDGQKSMVGLDWSFGK